MPFSANKPGTESKCFECCVKPCRDVIINSVYNGMEDTVGGKDVSDTPHLAFYSKDGKPLMANSDDWKDYIDLMKDVEL